MSDARQQMVRALNLLAKWRSVLAGWQLGTRTSDDPECRAVRDHREVTLILRAEVTALTRLMIEKGLATREEIAAVTAEEALEASRRCSSGSSPGCARPRTGSPTPCPRRPRP